jgi:short-subunit dehydrogenase
MKFEENERVLVLGGSRGLGKALVDQFLSLQISVESISRKSVHSFDFSKTESWPDVVEKIRSLQPTRIIYCAAGGPYGDFQKYEWKDHSWSLRVSFEFPAYLIHQLLKTEVVGLKQVCVIGSSIAENQADPGAAMYCAAKHGLKGLILTLQKQDLAFDLRLLSPGYMNTDLLPTGTKPRNQGQSVNPAVVADSMIRSITDSALRCGHQSFD